MLHEMLLQLLAVVALIPRCYARSSDLYCSACHLVVEEARFAIALADPKKMIQVGSFRINPDGTQRISQVPYARSSVHMTEVMESVCENAKDYMQSERADRVIYVRQNSRYASPDATKNLIMGGETTKRLRFACDSFVEEHEDDLVKIFVKDDGSTDPLYEACVRLSGACTAEQLFDVNEQPPEITELHKSHPRNKAKADAAHAAGESSEAGDAAGASSSAADDAAATADAASATADDPAAEDADGRVEL